MLDPTKAPAPSRYAAVVVGALVLVVLVAVGVGAAQEYGPRISAWLASDERVAEPDPCAGAWKYAAAVRPELGDLETLWLMARDDDGAAGFLLATDDGADAYRWAITVDRNPDCFGPERQADAALWLRRLGR